MDSASSETYVTVNVEDLLHFLDEKPWWAVGQATSVVSVVGEDLNTACFQHYLATTGACATVCIDKDGIKPKPVTTGRRRGPRLDRWIRVAWPDETRTVFQTEIKNWSAHAIGGKTLSIAASRKELVDYKQSRWNRHWDSDRMTLKDTGTAKVLVRMNPPEGVDENDIRPLLIFWEALGPRDRGDDHFFSVNACSRQFPFELPNSWTRFCRTSELWVFSVSSYLRSVSSPFVELNMPVAVHRLHVLSRLFPTGLQSP